MKIPDPRGAFGRQARFRDGPLPVVRLSHPVSGAFLQLPSTTHKYNLLQYVFTPTVSHVIVGRQLNPELQALSPHKRVQLVGIDGGAQCLLSVRRQPKKPLPTATRLSQYLWLLERDAAEIDAQVVLNRNLGTLAQLLCSHGHEPLEVEAAVLRDELRGAGSAIFGGLCLFAALRLGMPQQHVKVVLARLLLGRQIGVDLASGPLSNGTVIHWGNGGVGYRAPLPRDLYPTEGSA